MNKPICAAFLSCESDHLSDEEKYTLEKANPLGMALFARNIKSKTQLKNLIKEIRQTIGRQDVLIAVDQEGGRVRRLAEPEFRPYAAQIEIGTLSDEKAKEAAKLHAKLISADLNEVGFNVNFAPVLDTLHQETTQSLYSRCLSSQPEKVAALGQIMVETYMDNGILPCIKHLPGHGLAQTDPHLGLPVINAPLETLRKELFPFKKCAFAPLGMTAHILIPNIDDKNPLTQSKKGIQFLIRETAGFNGLLISDAIDMKALKGTIVEKAKKSIEAGCDCICYCMGNINELKDLSEFCPQLSDEATERLDKALQILHNGKESETTSSEAESYASLIGEIPPYHETYDATEVLHQLQKKDKLC